MEECEKNLRGEILPLDYIILQAVRTITELGKVAYICNLTIRGLKQDDYMSSRSIWLQIETLFLFLFFFFFKSRQNNDRNLKNRPLWNLETNII
jgi:hypothetical protein